MLSFLIQPSDVKAFMSKLLKEDSFDNLEVRSIYLKTIVAYDIDCTIDEEYLKEEVRLYVKWFEIKSYILSLIQGMKKPKLLKIVFSLEENEVKKLHQNGKAMFLNIIYENNEVKCTTGTSQKVFSLNDKSLDAIWEEKILAFFKKNNINIIKL